MTPILPYQLIGGPACGRPAILTRFTQRLWVPEPIWVGGLGMGDTIPCIELLDDVEMGQVLHEGAQARGPDVSRARVILEWVVGCYVADHCRLRMHWVDLQSPAIAQASTSAVRTYQLLVRYLLAEQALLVGDDAFTGTALDGVHLVCLKAFPADIGLLQRATHFQRRRISRLGSGN